jgi:hypothetical protein
VFFYFVKDVLIGIFGNGRAKVGQVGGDFLKILTDLIEKNVSVNGKLAEAIDRQGETQKELVETIRHLSMDQEETRRSICEMNQKITSLQLEVVRSGTGRVFSVREEPGEYNYKKG